MSKGCFCPEEIAPAFREVERPEQVGDTFLRSIFERPLGSWLGWRPALSTPY